MEQLSREEVDRLVFFEAAREQAETDYNKNNRDSQALTRWGGALLELAHFRSGTDAYDMIQDAVDKFKHALRIDSRKHEALWCLGNAYTSQGFLTQDTDTAHSFFEQATDAFSKAVKEDPSSDVYKKALEMTAKAPQLHAELQKQLQASQIGLGGGGGGGGGAATKGTSTDFWYDVGGWVTLFGIGFLVIALARGANPVPPGK